VRDFKNTIAEMKRLAKMGFTCAMLPASTPTGMPKYNDEAWDEIFELGGELGLVFVMHTGTGLDTVQIERRAGGFHAFALGGFERDQAGQILRGSVEALHHFSQPLIRKFHDLKLPQEAQVTAVHEPDVVDAVTHHRQTRQAEAEREAAPFIRIGAAGAQDGGMHQAAG